MFGGTDREVVTEFGSVEQLTGAVVSAGVAQAEKWSKERDVKDGLLVILICLVLNT